jgi:hypothetical protein
LKQEWFATKKSRAIVDRRDTFLRGDLFQGTFWKHNYEAEFTIRWNKFQLAQSSIDRFEEGTIRIKCELGPERHPQTIIRGMWSPRRYEDPAARLGIKVSGIRKADQQEGFLYIWLYGDSDRWIPRMNRFVDWLEGLDPLTLRSRRNYTGSTTKPDQYTADERYTRHPTDVGGAWNQLLTFEELEYDCFIKYNIEHGSILTSSTGSQTADTFKSQGNTFEAFHSTCRCWVQCCTAL